MSWWTGAYRSVFGTPIVNPDDTLPWLLQAFRLVDSQGNDLIDNTGGLKVTRVVPSRVTKVFGCQGVAGTASESALSCVMSSDLVSVAAASNYTVTTGKVFRCQGLIAMWRNATLTPGGVAIRLRATATGSASVASPLLAEVAVWDPTALLGVVLGATLSQSIVFPEGIDLPSGASLCLTQQAPVASAGVEARLIGYEYTP